PEGRRRRQPGAGDAHGRDLERHGPGRLGGRDARAPRARPGSPVRREGPLTAPAALLVDSWTDPFPRSRRLAFLDGAAWQAFAWRWGISLASLASGLITLFIFRRGVPHVGWIIGYVVVLWLLFAVLGQMRAALLAGGRHLVVAAGDYTIQTLYHGLLLFVLPGYFAATTFDGITVTFFGFSLFAGLNVALPLVGVSPAVAVVASAGLAALGLTPSFFARAGRWP